MSKLRTFIPLSASGPVRKAVLPDFKLIPPLHHGLEVLVADQGKLGTLMTPPPTTGWFGPIDPSFSFPSEKCHIGEPEDFDFGSLPPFVPPSQDTSLSDQAKAHDCWMTCSTSSITPLLSQLSILIQNYQPMNFPKMSPAYSKMPKYHTRMILEKPNVMVLNMVDGVCSLDKLNAPQGPNVLSSLGHMLEKYLTTDCTDFDDLNAQAKHEAATIDVAQLPQAYSYLKMGDCLFRSQLDCYDPSVGVFDIKTRATAKIRYKVNEYKQNLGSISEIKKLKGEWNSFEREYYDLVRSKFLAFSHQLRIGGMHGLFVAYHNTDLLQGFQYISLKEIDKRIFGSSELAESSFVKSTEILSNLMSALKQHSVDLNGMRVVSALIRDNKHNFLDIYLTPENATNKDYVHKFRLELNRSVNGKQVGATSPVKFKAGDDLQVDYRITHCKFNTNLFATDSFLLNDKLAHFLNEQTRKLEMKEL